MTTEFIDHAAAGQHHVDEAESWLREAAIIPGQPIPAEQCYSEAQTHATLALARFTAELAEQQRIANLLELSRANALPDTTAVAPGMLRALRLS